MPQLVDVPSIGTVEFPDGISDEEMSSSIKKTLAKQNPPKITVGPVGPVTVLDKPIPAPLRQPLVSPPFSDAISAVKKGYEWANKSIIPEETMEHQLIRNTQETLRAESVSPQSAQGEGSYTPAKLPVVEGIAGGVENLAKGFTSPLGIATLGMGSLPFAAQRAISLAFAAQMISQAPEQARQLGAEFGKPPEQRDTRKIAQLLTEGAGTVGFATLAAKHGLEPVKSLTPLTDQAVKQTVESKGGSDAIHQEASPVLPDVRTQPVSGEGQVPVKASGAEAGARSAPTGNAEEKVTDIQNVRPAIKTMDGNIVVGAKGDVHDDIIAKNGLTTKDIDSRLFVDANGNEISREQLAQMGVKSDKPVEGAHASDLADAQKAQESQSVAETKPAQSPAPPTTPPSTAPELVGMGGATPSEFAPGDTTGREVYGVAERVRQARAAAGEGPEVAPGQGINTPDSIQRGRELLTQGADPEKMMSDFEATKKLSSDDMAVARAHGEKLFQDARDIERKFGTDSPEYSAARKVSDAWDVRSKAMQTEWGKTGMAQQGATDIDTGSYTGLSRAFKQDTGRDFTPAQEQEAKTKSSDVTNKQAEVDAASEALNKDLAEKAGKAAPQPAIHPSILEAAKRIVAGLDKRADAARIRIREKLARASAGVDPTLLLDVAEVGASHLAHQIVDFAEWSAKVIEDVGDWVKPHLEDVYKKSNELLEGIKNAPETQKVVRERKQSGSKVVSDAIKSIYGKEADVSKGVAEDLKETPADSDRQRVVDAAEKQLEDERNALEVARVQEQAAKDAQAAANKTIREAAAERAKEETKQRVADAKRAKETAAIQDKAARDAQRATDEAARKAAIKQARDESSKRIADAKRAKEAAQVQEVAARKAQQSAQKRVRDAASKLAVEENKKRIESAKQTPNDEQAKATKRALDAANKVARDAATAKAKAENDARVAKSEGEKKAAQEEVKRTQKALDAASKRVRDAAAASAKAAREALANPEVPVWNKVKEYLDKGEDRFDDIRNKVAADLGMPVRKVTDIMTRDTKTKRLADDAWKKQQDLRRLKDTAKQWLRNQALPKWRRFISSIPRGLFGLKVGFHGTVALGTHAPMVAFQPRFWDAYFTNFGKMYKMVGSPAFHEMQVQDLLHDKNYTTARRAGLQNDPYQFEDFNSPDMSQYIGRFSGMGNRGYFVLKLLRQDMFNQHWEGLPKQAQIPEVAEAIADGVNKSTGVTKRSAPGGVSVGLFAPRLEASRVAWLAVDPLRAANTFINWKNATLGQKRFAIYQAKEKAWVFGTMMAMLGANQALLSASGSKQKVNFTDPMRSDYLKFKVGGMNVSYGNAMISMARLPARLFVGVKNEGKLNKIVYEDENTAKIMFDYARSQASPVTGDLLDLGLGRDFEERPLPRAGFGLLPGKTNMPKRLAAQGIKPYTWPEYLSQALPPIPFVEPVREVWKQGMGFDDAHVKAYLKAMGVATFNAGTGGRMAEDYEPQQK